ncbi:hypothetical protein ACSBR2_039174 [Camellia fascicularis]
MGDLRKIIVINVTNNFLTSDIPSSLGNLTVLESLDLSHNKLFGQIPRELAALLFLEVYIGNPGLCGRPLEKKCSPNVPAATHTDGTA